MDENIMVVEDDASIRLLLFDALSSVGFNVTLAKDGKESLDRMKNHRFDLLVTDINMPRIDGIELLKRMKRAGREEKVIVMTGNSENYVRLGSDIPPVFTVMNKPFPIHNFLEAVVSALSKPSKKRKKARAV